MNEERNKAMQKDYLSGIPITEVGIKYGISRQRVSQLMQRLNAKREYAPVFNLKRKLKNTDLEELRNSGETLEAVSQKLGVRPKTLKKYVDMTKYPKYAKGMKPCRKCGIVKPFSEFSKNKQLSFSGGVHSYCKECISKYHKDISGILSMKAQIWRDNNREKYREYHREYDKKKYLETKSALLAKRQ